MTDQPKYCLPPTRDTDGELLPPPSGGSWLRHADGSLSPADECTARNAGLAWAAATNAPLSPAPAGDTVPPDTGIDTTE
jgi:hypothetical protein